MLCKVVKKSDNTLSFMRLAGSETNGVPIGTIIAYWGETAPGGYLICNGSTFDVAEYPSLYAFLNSNILPDLREVTLVGAGTSANDYDEDNNPDGIKTHDVYSVKQFKDDQVQDFTVELKSAGYTVSGNNLVINNTGLDDNRKLVHQYISDASATDLQTIETDAAGTRTGGTTHGKQVGVNWLIKAIPGASHDSSDWAEIVEGLNARIDTKQDKEYTLEINGVEYDTVEDILEALNNYSDIKLDKYSGHPAGKSVGYVYFDTSDYKLYRLSNIDDTTDPITETWQEVGGDAIVYTSVLPEQIDNKFYYFTATVGSYKANNLYRGRKSDGSLSLISAESVHYVAELPEDGIENTFYFLTADYEDETEGNFPDDVVDKWPVRTDTFYPDNYYIDGSLVSYFYDDGNEYTIHYADGTTATATGDEAIVIKTPHYSGLYRGSEADQTVTLVNSTEIFIGTTSEWQAVTNKSLYKIAILTDKVTETIAVVDTVEEDNQNAVTSNAVYQAIQPVKFPKTISSSTTLMNWSYTTLGTQGNKSVTIPADGWYRLRLVTNNKAGMVISNWNRFALGTGNVVAIMQTGQTSGAGWTVDSVENLLYLQEGTVVTASAYTENISGASFQHDAYIYQLIGE